MRNAGARLAFRNLPDDDEDGIAGARLAFISVFKMGAVAVLSRDSHRSTGGYRRSMAGIEQHGSTKRNAAWLA